MEPKDDVYEESIANMFHQYGGLMKTSVEIDNTLGTDMFMEQVSSQRCQNNSII